MLKFARNKLVTVYYGSPEVLMVQGVLEDDMYGLEMDAQVRIADRRLISVTGKWHRYTTPECPRALGFIPKAEGLVITENMGPQLQKLIGREGCRHYATLLTEMCDTARAALQSLNVPAAASETDSTLRPAAEGPAANPKATFQAAPDPPSASSKKFPNEFVLDLHVHTFPASPCATSQVEDIIQQARAIGLDGICLTDHNHFWPPAAVAELRQTYNFPIFAANEITTDQGHILVFGLERPLNGQGIIKLADLRERITASGGFMIGAHPFRGFLTFGVGELGLTVEKAAARDMFSMLDAVEVLNGKVTAAENQFAAKVARHLNLPTTGGSDAHAISELGCYATAFKGPIADERHLVENFKAGNYRAVVL